MLAYGIFYGFTRNRELSKIETERRRQEELERPAKEAALKAERDKKYKGESSQKFDDNRHEIMRFFYYHLSDLFVYFQRKWTTWEERLGSSKLDLGGLHTIQFTMTMWTNGLFYLLG
jgi:hypothetical protein